MKLTIQSDGAPNYHQLIDFYNGRVLVRSWHQVFVYNLDKRQKYEGWDFNSGNYLFTTDTK